MKESFELSIKIHDKKSIIINLKIYIFREYLRFSISATVNRKIKGLMCKKKEIFAIE